MKLLFDENLSPRLGERLIDVFPLSVHVHSVGLSGAHDRDVWEFAKTNDYLIVTKDSDFEELSLLSGFPPKVVWLRRGNCTTGQIEAILRAHREDIELLGTNAEIAVLMLF